MYWKGAGIPSPGTLAVAGFQWQWANSITEFPESSLGGLHPPVPLVYRPCIPCFIAHSWLYCMTAHISTHAGIAHASLLHLLHKHNCRCIISEFPCYCTDHTIQRSVRWVSFYILIIPFFHHDILHWTRLLHQAILPSDALLIILAYLLSASTTTVWLHWVILLMSIVLLTIRALCFPFQHYNN